MKEYRKIRLGDRKKLQRAFESAISGREKVRKRSVKI